jgi:chemotaxis protein CheD
MPFSEDDFPDVYLRPGERFLARRPTVIRTILGSCVGITFWCARLGAGALCHTMLPCAPRDSSASMTLADVGRYVDSCIRDLARQFDELGARRSEIQIKLFGGADVLLVENTASRPTVGRLNCESAIKVLRDEGYEVAASSLGGNCGCKISFNTGSGEVLLLRLN